MKFEKIDCGNGIAVAVSSDSMIITDVDSALDLLMSAKYEAGTKYIVVDKKNIIEDLYDDQFTYAAICRGCSKRAFR